MILVFESDHNLLGIGVGVQILSRGLYARFDLAKPLRELKVGSVIDGTQSSDYRVHGNLGWNF